MYSYTYSCSTLFFTTENMHIITKWYLCIGLQHHCTVFVLYYRRNSQLACSHSQNIPHYLWRNCYSQCHIDNVVQHLHHTWSEVTVYRHIGWYASPVLLCSCLQTTLASVWITPRGWHHLHHTPPIHTSTRPSNSLGPPNNLISPSTEHLPCSEESNDTKTIDYIAILCIPALQ